MGSNRTSLRALSGFSGSMAGGPGPGKWRWGHPLGGSYPKIHCTKVPVAGVSRFSEQLSALAEPASGFSSE